MPPIWWRAPVPSAPAVMPSITPQPVAQPTPVPTTQPAATPAPAAPVVTPDYRGITAKRARALAASQGIVIIEDEEKAAEGKQPGEILEQNPVPGSPMATREIRVVVAQAGKVLDVPDVIGKDFESAKKALEEAGFMVPEPVKKDSPKTPGTVLAQKPSSAEKAPERSEIELEIASLPLIEVPKVTGMYASRSKQELKKVGLELGKKRYREHAEYGHNFVLSQEPKAGEKVPFGSTVDITAVAPN